MKRVFVLMALAGMLVSLPMSHLVWGKGHVKANKVQVCHEGEVIAVGAAALDAHLNHGDCQLPACDFNNVFFVGDPCSTSGAADGKCSLENPREPANTPACSAGQF